MQKGIVRPTHFAINAPFLHLTSFWVLKLRFLGTHPSITGRRGGGGGGGHFQVSDPLQPIPIKRAGPSPGAGHPKWPSAFNWNRLRRITDLNTPPSWVITLDSASAVTQGRRSDSAVHQSFCQSNHTHARARNRIQTMHRSRTTARRPAASVQLLRTRSTVYRYTIYIQY